jgi:hypothetical protein
VAQQAQLVDCPNCGEPLALIPSSVFRDEAAAAKLDLGHMTNTQTDEIVSYYALLRADGSYVCPVCSTRHQV